MQQTFHHRAGRPVGREKPGRTGGAPNSGAVILAALVLTADILSGCVPPDKYCVRRAALVPVPAPSLRPVRQASGFLEANLSSETLSYAGSPSKTAGRNVGLYVPREQLAGQVLLSPTKHWTLGLSFEGGIAQAAIPVSPGLIKSPSSGVGGAGFHVGLDFKLSPTVTLGLSCDVGPYWIQSRVAYYNVGSQGNCSNLPPPDTWAQKHPKSLVPFLRAQVGVGVDLGWGYLSIGAGLRNQPYNVDETTELHYNEAAITPEIRDTAYPYGLASLEIPVTDWMGVSLAVYQPLKFEPIAYTPIFGINVRFTAFRRKTRRRPARPVRAAGMNPRQPAGNSDPKTRREPFWFQDDETQLP